MNTEYPYKAKVCKEGYPDFTSWDKKSKYFDSKSTKEKPRWFMVDVEPLIALKGNGVHEKPLIILRLFLTQNIEA